MPAWIVLSRQLSAATAGRARLELAAGPVLTALETLCQEFPQLRPRLLDEQGRPHRHLALFVRDTGDGRLQDIRSMGRLEAELQDGDELILMPIVAGG